MRINFTLHQRWFRHFKVKIFSLLSALFLWFYVVTDNHFDHTSFVPLRLTNRPEGWILTEPIPDKVQVQFRATGKSFLSFGYRNKRIELDLRKIRRAATFPLTVDMIKGIPKEMRITPLRIVEPDSVMVRLDRFVEKRVPVRSNLSLIPLDGYIQVSDVILEPDSITISGPRSYVNDVTEVFTEGEEYRSVIKEIKRKITLIPSPRETVHYSLNTVRFRADVQRIGERLIKEIPIQVTHIPRSMKVTAVPSTLSITLQGGVNVLSKVKKEDISVTIDFRSRYRYKGRRIPATIQLPKDISFSNVKPQFFELIVER